MTFADADGRWPVVEWRVYYADGSVYCSCKGDETKDLPREGVQGINWHIRKDGKVRCHLENGCADDPTIYRIGRRKLIGTMMPDEAFFALEKRMMADAIERNEVLNGQD